MHTELRTASYNSGNDGITKVGKDLKDHPVFQDAIAAKTTRFSASQNRVLRIRRSPYIK